MNTLGYVLITVGVLILVCVFFSIVSVVLTTSGTHTSSKGYNCPDYLPAANDLDVNGSFSTEYQKSFEDCTKQCDKDSCTWFSWKEPSSCVIRKYTATPTESISYFNTGTDQCPSFVKDMYPNYGEVISSKQLSSAEECNKLCIGTNQCVVGYYSGDQCSLFKGVSNGFTSYFPTN